MGMLQLLLVSHHGKCYRFFFRQSTRRTDVQVIESMRGSDNADGLRIDRRRKH